jgi:putative transposase
MRKARFSEGQITYALKQDESGKPVGEVCRQLGVSEQSFYRWKRKYEGMGVAEPGRLRQLEEENRKLKKIVADLTLDKHILLRREGCRVNHKLVCRIYKEEGLEVRTKKRRKRVRALRVVIPAATVPNERWSMDFVSDSLHDGRRFRALTIVDHFTRESPAIEVGNSIPGRRVVAVLERLAKVHGLPQVITTDNGTELPLEPWTNGPIGTG